MPASRPLLSPAALLNNLVTRLGWYDCQDVIEVPEWHHGDLSKVIIAVEVLRRSLSRACQYVQQLPADGPNARLAPVPVRGAAPVVISGASIAEIILAPQSNVRVLQVSASSSSHVASAHPPISKPLPSWPPPRLLPVAGRVSSGTPEAVRIVQSPKRSKSPRKKSSQGARQLAACLSAEVAPQDPARWPLASLHLGSAIPVHSAGFRSLWPSAAVVSYLSPASSIKRAMAIPVAERHGCVGELAVPRLFGQEAFARSVPGLITSATASATTIVFCARDARGSWHRVEMTLPRERVFSKKFVSLLHVAMHPCLPWVDLEPHNFQPRQVVTFAVAIYHLRAALYLGPSCPSLSYSPLGRRLLDGKKADDRFAVPLGSFAGSVDDGPVKVYRAPREKRPRNAAVNAADAEPGQCPQT